MVRGIYVEKLASGIAYGVQVEDETARKRFVTPAEYATQNYEPPIEKLPDIATYLSQRTLIAKIMKD